MNAPSPDFARSANRPVKDLADVVEDIMPAVVSIGAIHADGKGGAGSGFIIDSENRYIVTNRHVIEGAESFKVVFPDHEIYNAELIGRDKLTDLAVLQVDAWHKLPQASVGDSDKMRVGNSVVAIGNPFGLGSTVTTGIVSGLDRNIGSGPYDQYIQTDAAINPGNSGGPLFNMDGEVIGVNTMIISRSGASAGIGFAIPSNQVKWVAEQIIKHGEVRRSFIGATLTPVTNAAAKEIKGAEAGKGILINKVGKDSPAEKAQLARGDIIIGVNGESIKNSRQFTLDISRMTPGSTFDLTILREGSQKQVAVTTEEMPAPQEEPRLLLLPIDPRGRGRGLDPRDFGGPDNGDGMERDFGRGMPRGFGGRQRPPTPEEEQALRDLLRLLPQMRGERGPRPKL